MFGGVVIGPHLHTGLRCGYITCVSMKLYIQPMDKCMREWLETQQFKHRPTDSGFDIPLSKQVVPEGGTHTFRLGIRVAATTHDGQPLPCLLLPRSSIAHTPFRLCNSIGLIDAGYRGEVQAKVDVRGYESVSVPDGMRLFQLVTPSFLPWSEIHIVNALPEAQDSRGDGGFGSTG